MSAERVTVFLDWQNIYGHARDAFHDRDAPFLAGQVDPVALAERLVASGPPEFERVLHEIRVYRGLPSPDHDPSGYATVRRQHAAWRTDPRVRIHERLLVYPPGWPDHAGGRMPQEKGVDVALATDLVAEAADRSFDVGIVFSADHDLLPALELLATRRTLRGHEVVPRVEVAAWKPATRHGYRLHLGGRLPWCHWLDQEAYEAMRDTHNYKVDDRVAAGSEDAPPAAAGLSLVTAPPLSPHPDAAAAIARIAAACRRPAAFTVQIPAPASAARQTASAAS